jgi:predicted transcriptional regulator
MSDTAGILLSVHPKWADLILSGQKTVELRRVTPKRLKPGMAVVLYQTGTGIVGEATVSSVCTRRPLPAGTSKPYSGMHETEALVYLAGASSPCAIWLRGARRYARPIPLPIMRGMGGPDEWLDAPQSFHYLSDNLLAAIRREAGEEEQP